jgi:hypothetical protein
MIERRDVVQLLDQIWNGLTTYPATAIPFFSLVVIAAVLLYAGYRPEADDPMPSSELSDAPWLPPVANRPSSRSVTRESRE